MAIFGTLEVVKNQVDNIKFKKAFEYLEQVLTSGTEENNRLLSLPVGAFEKVDLDETNFGLEQVYYSKDREDCFFESHRQYIDVQFILEGEEIIEVGNTDDLKVDIDYNETIDLLKYNMTNNSSIIKLRRGDVAIFFPDDAHMPCVKLHNSDKVVKTVVKVRV
jgi:YhcH/YjgK/YiaL family protein